MKRFLSLLLAAVLSICLFGCSGPKLSAEEQIAYEDCLTLQSMLKDPDSFKLYDEMFLLKCLDDDGSVKYTYTVFRYGGTNGYGATTTDEAIFKDGEYIMDYGDEADQGDSHYGDQLMAQFDLSTWKILGDGDSFQTVEIDVEKIKDKMGLD